MSENNATNSEDVKKGGSDQSKSNKIIIIIAAIIILALIIVIVVLLGSAKKAEKIEEVKEAVSRGTVVNEDNAEIVAQVIEEQEKVPVGYYEVTMNAEWKFENGTVASENAYVENSTANENSVYFDVIRRDTDEVVYESPILPVGQKIDSIVLKEDMDAGTYDCVCTYHLLDNDNVDFSQVSVAVTLVINN